MAEYRFQMVGARTAVSDGPISEAILQQLHAIENALESVPDFAFDLSKTLVESVRKTVLADIGQPAASNWDAPQASAGDDEPALHSPTQPSGPGKGA